MGTSPGKPCQILQVSFSLFLFYILLSFKLFNHFFFVLFYFIFCNFLEIQNFSFFQNVVYKIYAEIPPRNQIIKMGKFTKKKPKKDIFFASFAHGIRETFIILHYNNDGIEQHSLCLSCDFDKHLLLLPYTVGHLLHPPKQISSRVCCCCCAFFFFFSGWRIAAERRTVPVFTPILSVDRIDWFLLSFYFLTVFEYLVLMECLTRTTLT